jgi:hypothetical protein
MKTSKSQQVPSGGSDDRLVRLLPCPFCGTESGTPTGPMYLKNGDMWEGMMHDVHCINCTTTMSDYSREKVEAKWNLRCLPNATGQATADNNQPKHQ